MADAHAIRDHHPAHEELGGYEGSKMGMWLFLATELLLFAVMFAAFTIFHAKFVEPFKLAHHSLDKVMGGINTIVLILSSVTAVLALDSVQRGKKKLANIMLACTIAFAGVFMVIKYIEYSGKFSHGILPGSAEMIIPLDAHDHHSYANTDAEIVKIVDAEIAAGEVESSRRDEQIAYYRHGIDLFFTFYFLMTGVHGLHVLIGMGIIAVLLIKNIKGRYSHWYYTPVENGTLYWHLVDLIWIYVFPLFYLVR